MIGLLQMNCPPGKYNEISSFWLHTQEEIIRSLFHYPIGNYSVRYFRTNILNTRVTEQSRYSVEVNNDNVFASK